jgi:hypothetical protein
MLEKIKSYLQDKTKLWKTAMILSIVLFLVILFFLIWRLAVMPGKNEGGARNTGEAQNAAGGSAAAGNECPGCVRRLLDGVYVAAGDANFPPVAVMIDNHPLARPPAGLEKANLVYEAEVEGSYTRYMAVFANRDKISLIGPVRSARPYFAHWAAELGAVYAHCGGSPEALVEIARRGIVDLNEFYNGQYFWRAEDRTAPFNIMTSDGNIKKFLENKKIASGDYSFWQFKDDGPSTSPLVSEIGIKFKLSDFQVKWIYNPPDNDYIRYLAGTPQLTQDKNPILAKNIIIQIIPAEVIDEKLRLKMEEVGTGIAVICLDGECRKGKWEKKSVLARTKFYYENGEEVRFNAGPTWVEAVRPEIEVTY